jgi:nucleotide-binding universal stress UspA family protein
MYKHVLVSLDYSSLSEMAVPHALSVISPDGQLTLLIAIEDIRNDPIYVGENFSLYTQAQADKVQEDLRQRATLYLRRITDSLQNPPPKINHIVESGSPADAIIDFATNNGVDVIVICTHGRTGLSRWLMGSVTQKVLSSAPCPVIVVPNKEVIKQSDTTKIAT